MDKNEIIAAVSNDILQKLNINSIISIVREYSITQAQSYYESLSEEDIAKLVDKILAAKAEAEKNQEAEKEAQEEATT